MEKKLEKNFFKGYKSKNNNIFKEYLRITYYYKEEIEDIINKEHNANVITLFYTKNKLDKYDKMLSYYEGIITSLNNTYNINKDEIIKYDNREIKIGEMITYLYIDDSIINLCEENKYIKSFFDRYKIYNRLVFVYYKKINDKIKQFDENDPKYHNKTFGTTMRYISLLDKNIKSVFIHDTDNTFNSIFHIRKIQNLINENPYQYWYLGSGYKYNPYHIVNRDRVYKTKSSIKIKINEKEENVYITGGIFYSLKNFILNFKDTKIKYNGEYKNIYGSEEVIYKQITTIFGVYKLMLLNTLSSHSQGFGVDEYFINRFIRFIQDCIIIKDTNNMNVSNQNFIHLNQQFFTIEKGELLQSSFIKENIYHFNKVYNLDLNFNIDYNYFSIPNYSNEQSNLYSFPNNYNYSFYNKYNFLFNYISNNFNYSNFIKLLTDNSNSNFKKYLKFKIINNTNYIKLDSYINIFYVNLYNVDNAYGKTIYNGYKILLYRHFYNNESKDYICQMYMFNDLITLLFILFSFKDEFIVLIENHIIYQKYFEKLKLILKSINLCIYDIYRFIKLTVLNTIFNKNANPNKLINAICDFYPIFCDTSEKYLKDIGKIDFFHTYKRIFYNNHNLICDFDISNKDYVLSISSKNKQYKFVISFNPFLKFKKIKELYDANLSDKNKMTLSLYLL